MKQKTIKIAILSLLTVILLSLCATSFAWFARKQLTPTGAEVVSGYYAGGDGTESSPYLITRPIHLYNLAWLQLQGTYNQVVDGNPPAQTYFELGDNLDMKGLVIPPIGTVENPFLGIFSSTQGKKYTISNLTVSNVIDNDEITKRPFGTNIEGANIVGMFGVIGVHNDTPNGTTYSSIIPRVENFFLDNPTIRTQTEKSLIGLIAGYVNGKVHELGVRGGTLIAGEENSSGLTNDSISLYGLIGDKHNTVGWDGIPSLGVDGSSAGGTIKVDPTDFSSSNLPNGDTVKYVPVPNSIDDSAFIVGDASAVSATVDSTPYYHKTIIASSSTQSVVKVGTNGRSDFQSFSESNYTQQNWPVSGISSSSKYNDDFANVVPRFNDGSITTIANGTTAPSSDTSTWQEVTLKETDENGTPKKLSIPNNGIWFRPVATGNCIVSFVNTDNSCNMTCKSIYKYKRTSSGISDWQEIRFYFYKKNYGPGGLGPKTIVVFEYEVELGYEYIIGAPTKTEEPNLEIKDNVRFIFLALPGASLTGGGAGTNTSKELFEVNFITANFNGTSVIEPNMIVSTFFIQRLNKEPTLISVSFNRTLMTAPVVATYSTTDFFVRSYDYKVPIPNTT